MRGHKLFDKYVNNLQFVIIYNFNGFDIKFKESQSSFSWSELETTTSLLEGSADELEAWLSGWKETVFKPSKGQNSVARYEADKTL